MKSKADKKKKWKKKKKEKDKKKQISETDSAVSEEDSMDVMLKDMEAKRGDEDEAAKKGEMPCASDADVTTCRSTAIKTSHGSEGKREQVQNQVLKGQQLVQRKGKTGHSLMNSSKENYHEALSNFYDFKKVIVPFAVKECENLQKELMSQACDSCVRRGKLCSDSRDRDKKELTCVDKWSKELERFCDPKFNIEWKYQTPSTWITNAWSLTWCYTNVDQRQRKSPLDTDPSAILAFIINCRKISANPKLLGIKQSALKVRANRHYLAHFGENTLSFEKLKEFQEDMAKLLRIIERVSRDYSIL